MNPFYLPGPQFLLFYIIFAGLVIAGLVFWRRRAESSASTPRIDLSDPYLIAYLRGGEKAVLRVATVTLIDRGFLVRTGRQIQRAQNAQTDSVRIPVEQVLLKKYARPGEVSWMFEDDGLSKACEPYGATLRRARLLPDDSVNTARLIRLVVATFLLTAVGFTKVVIAIDAGRSNVGFLILLIIASLVTVAALSFPRLTESGREMIQSVQSLYSGLQSRTASASAGAVGNAGSAGVEPVMLAAVFGVGALAGSGFMYAQGLFPGADKRRGSCASDGDCGSSCSSGDSGSSSSSCSSGSSCGSGCGGGCGGCGGS